MNTQTAPKSEQIVIAAPMSFAGSAGRIWRLTRLSRQPVPRIGLATLAALVIVLAWTVVLAWYLCFGLLLVPYRIVRRGQRKNKRDKMRHRELLASGAPVARR